MYVVIGVITVNTCGCVLRVIIVITVNTCVLRVVISVMTVNICVLRVVGPGTALSYGLYFTQRSPLRLHVTSQSAPMTSSP